jgi:hypothetical protein
MALSIPAEVAADVAEVKVPNFMTEEVVTPFIVLVGTKAKRIVASTAVAVNVVVAIE